jgi:thiamine-phosphate pyrophosphorylase
LKPLGQCRLYGILDLGYVRAEEAPRITARMLEGGVDILQLRAKGYAAEQIVGIAASILPIAREAGAPLVINDFPDLVPQTGAAGAHIGQDDGNLLDAKRLAGETAFIGKSTHSVQQAVDAAREGADYIGFGPLFATPTKPDYIPIGLDSIRRVHELVTIPIFCIGGIKLENLGEVLAAGATRVVIVSGILRAADAAGYARRAKNILLSRGGD